MGFLKFSLILISWFCFVGQVIAAEPGEIIFQDDFSTDLTKWQITRGSPAVWQLVDGVLEANLLTTSTISELVPRSDLWQSDWQNYRLELDIQPMAGVDRNLAWGYQDPLNWYEIHFLPDFFELARLRDGQLAWSQSANFNLLTTGQWHHLRLEMAGDKIQIWLDGSIVTLTTDPSFQVNLGTIALKIGSGSVAPVKMKFDNLKVTLLSDPREINLAVPAIRQDHPSWANELYDAAGDWAEDQPTTISRWGCALTSAVMMLNYYGYTQLTDELPLTPATLNDWLKSQPDGYLGGLGWVNWLAIVRLANELRPVWSNSIQPLPQLKYVYQRWLDWQTAGLALVKPELIHYRPLILELPGHFIVARGITADGADILINDPARSTTVLKNLNQLPISGRFWQAEFTPELIPLRYWLVRLPRGLRIKIFSQTGELIGGSWLSQDAPGTEVDQPVTQPWSVLVWPDPPVGVFKLELARATGDETLDGGLFPVVQLPDWLPLELELWVYDDQARPTKLSLKTSLGLDPAVWRLETSLTAEPTVVSSLTWLEWRQVGLSLRQSGLMPGLIWARANYLAGLAEIMQNLPDNSHQTKIDARYASWINQILIRAQADFSAQLEMVAALEHWRGLLMGKWGET